MEYPTFRQHFAYDALGRKTLETTTDLLGSTTSVRTFAYDANGNLLHQIDPNGHVTAYEYDAHNRLTASMDAQGTRTAYTWIWGRLSVYNYLRSCSLIREPRLPPNRQDSPVIVIF